MGLFPNELERLTQRAMAEKVMGWLQAHPVLGVSSENRLSRQCRLVVESHGRVDESHPNWRLFVQSLKDLQEYWFMIEILGEELVRSPFVERFTRSLLDATHPHDSKAGTPGRDAQFELFLAAIAARAGLVVDQSGDGGADWMLTSPIGRWSLEAKRIKSLKKMRAHLSKAATQIMESRIGGVIAMDISLACNPDCKPLPGVFTLAQIAKADEARMNSFIEQYGESIMEWVGSANVGFVLLHDFVIRTPPPVGAPHEPAGLVELWRKVDLVGVEGQSRCHYDDLWHLIEVAVPNL